jgi:hypothetical protein
VRRYWALVAATYVGWCSFWLIVGLFAAWRQSIASEFFLAASRTNDLTGMQIGNDSSHYFATWITRALIYGGLWPLPVLVALIVGGLTYTRVIRYKVFAQ